MMHQISKIIAGFAKAIFLLALMVIAPTAMAKDNAGTWYQENISNTKLHAKLGNLSLEFDMQSKQPFTKQKSVFGAPCISKVNEPPVKAFVLNKVIVDKDNTRWRIYAFTGQPPSNPNGKLKYGILRDILVTNSNLYSGLDTPKNPLWYKDNAGDCHTFARLASINTDNLKDGDKLIIVGLTGVVNSLNSGAIVVIRSGTSTGGEVGKTSIPVPAKRACSQTDPVGMGGGKTISAENVFIQPVSAQGTLVWKTGSKSSGIPLKINGNLPQGILDMLDKFDPEGQIYPEDFRNLHIFTFLSTGGAPPIYNQATPDEHYYQEDLNLYHTFYASENARGETPPYSDIHLDESLIRKLMDIDSEAKNSIVAQLKDIKPDLPNQSFSDKLKEFAKEHLGGSGGLVGALLGITLASATGVGIIGVGVATLGGAVIGKVGADATSLKVVKALAKPSVRKSLLRLILAKYYTDQHLAYHDCVARKAEEVGNPFDPADSFSKEKLAEEKKVVENTIGKQVDNTGETLAQDEQGADNDCGFKGNSIFMMPVCGILKIGISTLNLLANFAGEMFGSVISAQT